jgi:hypothetical protein
MIEPKTIREAVLQIEGVEGRLALLTKLTLGVLGALGLIGSAGVAILVQLGDMKTDVSVIKKDIAQLQKDVGVVVQGQGSIQNGLGRIEGRLPASKTLIAVSNVPLSPADIQFIRDFLKQQPQRAGTNSTVKIGDLINESQLMPLPDAIVGKVPALKGGKYIFDQDNSIVIALDNRAMVFIPAI